MKNNFKYLITSLLISLLFPIVTNAAGITLEEVKNNSINTADYNIVYDPTSSTESSIKIEINRADDGLKYEINKAAETILGDCNPQSLSCTINVQEIQEKTTLATLKITNDLTVDKDVIPSIMGTYSATAKAISLKAITTTTTTTTTTTQKILSTETSLSSIDLSVGTIDQEFNKDITTYNVTGIKDTVNSITVTPNCDNNCSWVITCPLGECSVSNSRRVTLQTGANKISITVTSEDGNNNKSYVLNIYRGEIETSSAYLSDIKIKDAELSPNFDSMTNDYTATVGLDVEKLDIDTIAEDPEADIKIKGNENLKEGENTITITVTSSDNENKQVYTLVVTKEAIEEEPIEEEEEKKDITTTVVEKKKNNTWIIILLIVLAVGAITTTGILLFRKKKNKNNKNKNDKNNKNGGTKIADEPKLKEETNIEKENTESLNILNETRRQMNDEPKQDIDEALDDLMQTKRLELGDLGL